MFAPDKKEVIFGLILALFLAVFIAPFASRLPDGLEKVAQGKGLLGKTQVKPLVLAPIPDYHWPGIKNKKISAAISGLAGTLAVFIIGYLAAACSQKRRKPRKR
jgi:cobalt/nickel transport protein